MGKAAQVITIEDIREVAKLNPRRLVDPRPLDDLIASVRERGILQPIIVRPDAKSEGGYELVVGRRRLAATKACGLDEIPGTVLELTDDEALEVALIENLQRQDMHPLEEAESYKRLLAEDRWDIATIAARVGRSAQYVYDRLRLLQLCKEARRLFEDGRITAGHAIALSRIPATAQAKAIDPENDALWQHEVTRGLFVDEDEALDDAADAGDTYAGYKVRSVAELQGWINRHVRFDPAAEDVPQLFPETHQAIATAREEAEKVIHITHENVVTPAGKEGDDTRIFGPLSWKRADGSATAHPVCEYSVTGVVVVGPERGAAFKVCTDKKRCQVHWKTEVVAAKRLEKAKLKGNAGEASKAESAYQKQQEREKQRREKEDRERTAWKKAAPKIAEAVAEAIRKASPTSTAIVALAVGDRYLPPPVKKACEAFAAVKTAEDLVRYLAFRDAASDILDEWSGVREGPKVAKLLGVDVKPFLEDDAPPPAPKAASKPKAKATGKPKGKAKAKAGKKAPKASRKR